MVKHMKGKLEIRDPRIWWPETLDHLSATPLPLRDDHIAEIYNLDPIHQDPFDRMLIAQAIREDLTLVTTDDTLMRYASNRLRIVM
jgi:PIN domain nuclease of toxin-antitoxin system